MTELSKSDNPRVMALVGEVLAAVTAGHITHKTLYGRDLLQALYGAFYSGGSRK